MKLKNLTVIIVISIAIVAILGTASKSENSSKNSETSFEETVERIAGNNLKNPPDKKLEIQPSKPEWDHQPIKKNISMEELAGTLNKEYGIREDILRHIEKEIPPENVVARKAAIKYAQADQFIYYKATQEEAIKAESRQMVALECLRYSIHNDNPKLVARDIAKLMRDTPERDKHMWHIDETYFGWKVIGHEPITKDALKQMCETGNY